MEKIFLLLILISVFLFVGLSHIPESVPDADMFGGGNLVQIGLVVKDIEKTSQAYADFLGVDVPQWFLTDTVDKAHTEFKGSSSPAQAKLAFFQLNNITIELIEPVGGPSTWQEFLETKGEGVHHIAFEIKGMEEKIKQLAAKDMVLVQKGDYEGGRYSYIDASSSLCVLLELLENF